MSLNDRLVYEPDLQAATAPFPQRLASGRCFQLRDGRLVVAERVERVAEPDGAGLLGREEAEVLVFPHGECLGPAARRLIAVPVPTPEGVRYDTTVEK